MRNTLPGRATRLCEEIGKDRFSIVDSTGI